MGKKILITEKPSVAMEFAKALKITTARKNGYLESNEWIITWCVGHLVTMSYPEKYDDKLKFWNLNTLPFIPEVWKYEIIPNVKDQFNVIKNLIKNNEIDIIYVGTDSGREGEYIYRLVEQMLKIKGIERKRIWIDSQTEEEILRGIREAKDLAEYDSLSASAYLRAKEDYLIGINFSRLLSIIYGKELAKRINTEKASIAVGRVMTCVLGMIVSREREIRNFIKTKFYKINGEFGKEDQCFTAEWKVTEKSDFFESPKLYNETGLKKEEETKQFIKSLEGKEAKVIQVKKSKLKENAPLLFNLAEIQNECTKKFKIKPDETLKIIQNLYEKKLVTYPRTDARVLSTAVAKEIKNNLNGIARGYMDEEVQGYIRVMAKEKYPTDIIKTKYVNDSKITDHYAITPTGQGYENFNSISDLEKNIYKMIVKRFLAIFYPAAEFNKLQVTVEVGEKESFFASEKVCVKSGYLELLKPTKDKKDESESKNNSKFLNGLKKGQDLDIKTFNIKDSETSPPNRYNSGSLILAMENAGKLIEDEELREQIKGAGIGTSATRSEIIKKLEKILYMQINNKTQIVTPTQKGELIYDVVNSAIPDMLNPKLTASWEKGLEMVANKEIKEEEFTLKLNNYIHSKVKKFKVY